METLHQTTGMILNRLGDVLLLLGRLQHGQEISHQQLVSHSHRLGHIERSTAVIYERVAGHEGRIMRNTGRLDEMDRQKGSPTSPGLDIKDWLKLAAAAAILIAGLIAQLPLDKIARALAVVLKGG